MAFFARNEEEVFSEWFCDLIYRFLIVGIPYPSISIRMLSSNLRGMEDAFSRNLQSLIFSGHILRFRVSRARAAVFHLLYADDMFLFCNGGKRSVEGLMQLVQEYQDDRGQRINADKSCFVLPRKAPASRDNLLHECRDFA